jgi:trimeric autotransporter adhesin
MLKQFIQTALLLVVLCTTATTYAQIGQSPDGIQFQALATDANGHPAAGRVIYVKDAIVAKTATGTIVYSETFKVTASSAGVFTIVLGKGTYASGVTSIANIDWSNGPFFLNLKIAVEPTVPVAGWNVNNEYVDLGTSQFWSVPYALYAGNVKGADGKLNTSDTAAMLKPYFTAINLKANIESPTFTGTVRGVTKAMVGLGNVDNTADLDKPVSTATKTALDLKANTADVTTALALKANATDVTTALDLKVDKVTGKALSTNDYTTAEKTKLAAITGTNTGDQDLSALAIAADVSAALALKANTAEVNSALDTKVSSADATAALALKANIADVNAALALKANGANVANSLALKANTADVNAALVLKANTTDVASSLALKADNLTVTNQLATKEDKLNKSVDVAVDGALDTKYPSVKAVKTYVDAQVAGATIADANATSKGKIQLAGDLAGTSAAPTVPGLALKAPIASPTFTGTVTAPTYASTPIALTYTGSNINWNPAQGLNAAITLTQNSGLNFTVAPPVGSYGTVVLTQDATGSRTITLPTIAGATNKVLGSTSTSTVALSTAANSKDILNFYFDGTSCYWNIGQGYGTANQAPFTLTTTGTGAATLVGTTLNIPNVTSTNASSLTGVVPIANGGTGTTTVAGIKSVLGFNSSSVAIGDQAGQTNQGSSTVGVGGGAGATNQGNGSVAVGYVAGYNNQGSASIAMGSNAAQSGQGTQAVALGYAAGQNGQGDYSVAVGSFAGNVQAANSIALNATGTSLNPSTTGFFVAPIRNASSSSSLFYNSTTKEITYGAPAASGVPYTGATGSVDLGAYDLTVHGIRIGRGNSGVSYNTVVGLAALNANTTGNYNNAFGSQALAANVDGYFNSAFGQTALFKNTSGYDNSAYGFNALNGSTTGSNNSAIGSNSLVNSTTGSGNSALGMSALAANTTGSNNTGVGYQANVAANNLTNATAIGYGAIVAASNTIQLGNANVTTVNTNGALTAASVTTPIYASTPQVLADGSTVVWNPTLGLNASVTLAGNRNLTFLSTPIAGAYGTLVVTQDATGGRTLNLPSAANKVLGSTSTTTISLSTAAGAKDIVNFYYDGTNYFWNVGQGYGSAATSSTTNLASSVTGTLPVANGGTGAVTLTGLVKGNGTSAMTAATAGTDYQAPIILTTTGTGAATLSGTTLNIPSVSTVRLNSDEFTATTAQTSFTLTQTALNAKVFMFINGTRIKNGAFSVSGTTVTYTAASNNSYALVAGDRIQFDYAY